MDRVAVHHLPAAIRGEMQGDVAVAKGELCLGTTHRTTNERARGVVAERAVECLVAGGAMTRRPERPVDGGAPRRGRATEGTLDVGGREAAPAHAQLAVHPTRAAAREDLHDAGDRIGAVEDARGATHDLDPLDVV